MAPRSSISKNPAIQQAVEQLIADGSTVDEIHEAVAEYGVSRSAVGRYAKRYRPMVETLVRDNAVRQALRRHLPEGVDTGLIDVALHRAQAEVLRSIDALGDEEGPGSAKEVGGLVRALRSLIASMREKKAYEDEVRESERQKAVEAAEGAGREAGVYQRICLVQGKPWSKEAEEKWEADIRKTYGEAAEEELDVIPAKGTGIYLARATILAAMSKDLPVVRLRCPDGFERRDEAWRRDWLAELVERDGDDLVGELAADIVDKIEDGAAHQRANGGRELHQAPRIPWSISVCRYWLAVASCCLNASARQGRLGSTGLESGQRHLSLVPGTGRRGPPLHAR